MEHRIQVAVVKIGHWYRVEFRVKNADGTQQVRCGGFFDNRERAVKHAMAVHEKALEKGAKPTAGSS